MGFLPKKSSRRFIKENVNPIKKVEKSQFVLASVMHAVDEKLLVLKRLKRTWMKRISRKKLNNCKQYSILLRTMTLFEHSIARTWPDTDHI